MVGWSAKPHCCWLNCNVCWFNHHLCWLRHYHFSGLLVIPSQSERFTMKDVYTWLHRLRHMHKAKTFSVWDSGKLCENRGIEAPQLGPKWSGSKRQSRRISPTTRRAWHWHCPTASVKPVVSIRWDSRRLPAPVPGPPHQEIQEPDRGIGVRFQVVAGQLFVCAEQI